MFIMVGCTSNENALVGRWEPDHEAMVDAEFSNLMSNVPRNQRVALEYLWLYGRTSRLTEVRESFNLVFVFNQDGTGEMSLGNNSTSTIWILNGNQIAITSDESGDIMNLTYRLSRNRLHLNMDGFEAIIRQAD